MALVLAPVLPELLGDHQVVLGMHVLKRPLVVSRSGHSLNSILLAFGTKVNNVPPMRDRWSAFDDFFLQKSN